MPESERKWSAFSVIFMTFGFVTAVGIFFLQFSAYNHFTDWPSIYEQYSYETPAILQILINQKPLLLYAPALLTIIIFAVVLVGLSQKNRGIKLLLLIGSLVVFLFLVLAPVSITYNRWAYLEPERKISKSILIELDEIPVRNSALEYAQILSSDATGYELSQAAFKLEYLGLKQQFHSEEKVDPRVIQHLIEISNNVTKGIQARFHSAKALLVLECQSPESQQAIRKAIETTAADPESELGSNANTLIQNHPFFR